MNSGDALTTVLGDVEQLIWFLVIAVAVVGAAYLTTAWLTRLQRRLHLRKGLLKKLAAWLPLIQIAIWLSAALLLLWMLLAAPTGVAVVVLVPLLVLAIVASRDVARNAVAGAVLAFEHSIYAGDVVDVATPTGEIRGQVIAIGLRRTLLETSDEGEIFLPNHTLLNSIVRMNKAHQLDSLVEFDLPVPKDFGSKDFARVRDLARRAVAASRFASPKRDAEVFLETGAQGRLRVTVHAYAFDPDYTRHLASDVLAMIEERLRA